MKVHLWSPGFRAQANGISSYSNQILAALVELGNDLRLFGKTDTSGVWGGARLWGSGTIPGPFQTAHFGAAIVAGSAVLRPDHIISAHLNFGPAAHLAKRAIGTPYTLICYGIDVHPGLSPARQQALRAADRILVISDWTRERVLELGEVDEARVGVLPPTFDEARFPIAPDPKDLRQRYNLRDDEKVVLTVARLDASEAYKGYDRILQAVAAIPRDCGPVRFVIVGRGDDRSRIETMTKSLGIQTSVTFAGFVPDDELADHYRLADVFAMPSTGEGFGIVFLEAMACGTPVLGGNRDGSVDALDGGRLGLLVDPLDVGAIANGIIALLKRQGPPLWFDKAALHDEVTKQFGRAAFRQRLGRLFH